MNSTIPLKRKIRYSAHTFLCVLIFSPLLLPFGTVHSDQPIFEQTSPEQFRSYRLAVTTSYNNLTSAYLGILELTLNASGFRTYRGHLVWNLTWDDGNTWSSYSADYTYAWNRSYQFAGISLYTGWWIHPSIQIGDQVQIDGDSPATNNLLRTAPFEVTDLVSLQIHEKYYLCWQLSYASSQPQYETYYYEFHTGILISATSILLEGNQPVHEVYVELASTSPPLPAIHPFLHYWTNYQSLIIAFIAATLVTLLVYYMIQHFLPPRSKIYQSKDPRQNT